MRAEAGLVARTALLGAAILICAPWINAARAQQARQQPAPPQSTRAEGAPCFTAAEPAVVAAACDVVIRADRGTYTAEQIGLALQRRGGARSALGRIEDAISDFRQMAAAGYKPHEAHASIGSLEFRRQRLREAETSYREALRINPSYGLAQVGLGHTLIGLGKPAEAVGHFDRALATSESDAGAHLGKGTALAATGDLEGALKSLDSAIRVDPRLLPAFYQRAQVHHDKGDLVKALADADAAVGLALGEERVRALSYRGRLRNNAKTYDGSIADCAAADQEAERLRIGDGRTRAAALVCLGLARQSKGELAEAQQNYDAALRWDDRDVMALAGRGYVLLQRGRYDAAIADFQAALRLDPRSQDALRFLGLTYSDKGDRAKAEETFTRAIAIDPRDPWPVMIRAISAARDGDRTRALDDAAKALALTGANSSDGHLVRSAVHYFLDDLDRARADLDTSIRLNSENGQAHRLLARLLIRTNRLDDAQKALDTSARLMPNDATVILQRGLLALARRDFSGAVREISQSLAINDAHAEAYSARGQAYEAQGQTQAAIADYRTAEAKIAIDPDSRRAKAVARERLAALTAPQTSRAGAPSDRDGGTKDIRPSQPSRGESEASIYCRLVEGVFVHSRKYTGVEFDVGCAPKN